MIIIVFIIMVISSFEVGIMSEIRKAYQVKNGTGIVSTAVFLLVAMAVTAIFGLAATESFGVTGIKAGLSIAYALISAITAYLCLVGSAWGNVSIIVICATLGSLVFPSMYGIIVQPEENAITVQKIIGFIFAFITMLLNFADVKTQKVKAKSGIKYKLSCIVVFITQGVALIILNLVQKSNINNFEFLAMYAIVSVITMALLIGAVMIKKRKDACREIKRSISPKNLLFMVGYSVLAFTSELLALYCAGRVPLTFQAPVSFCVPVITIAFLDYILYKEKLNKIQKLQILTAVISCTVFVV